MKAILWTCVILGFFPHSVWAYYENYPPYKFKERPYQALNAVSLSDKDVPKVVVDSDLAPLHDVYRADVDGNGLEDFIVLEYSGAGTLVGDVSIYLRRKKGGYAKIFYEASGIGIEDFCDIDRNGKYEVIIADVYSSGGHNYLAYDVYEFKNYRLVNADHKFRGFPKFVWMTYKSNDKASLLINRNDREKHVRKKNRSIGYGLMP